MAGRFRNRRISVPDGAVVRPTSELVREALFNILGPDVVESSVLDLFAGTGAVGLESLSRGAHWVTFVESDRGVLSVLRRNVGQLGVESQALVVEGAVERVLSSRLAGAPFDLIFADPPYRSASRAGLVGLIGGSRVLASGGRLIVERARRSAPDLDPGDDLQLLRTVQYGDTCLDFYGARSRLGNDPDPRTD